MSTSTTNETLNAACPECAGLISFDRQPLSGQIAQCGDCGAELEVISRDPIKMELAPEVEEDWGE